MPIEWPQPMEPDAEGKFTMDYDPIPPMESMNLRDYFASLALVFLGHQYHDSSAANLSEVPHEAYLIADAMLAQRDKKD